MTSKIYEVSWGGRGSIIWKLVETGTNTTENLTNTAVKISKSILVLDLGLNLINIGLSAAILIKINKVDEKIEKMNAKFDLLFLDNSIEYFLNQRDKSSFPNEESLNILENDLFNALCSIESTRDLRLPAYLIHKIYLLAEAISQINETIYMILHNGSAPRLAESELENWVKEKGAEIDLLPNGCFATQVEVLRAVEKLISDKETAFFDRFKITSKNRQGILVRILSEPSLFEVSHPLVLLLRELRLASSFRSRLEQEVKSHNGKLFLKVV